MPAILANANNLLLTTDYPIDQIIYMTSGNMVSFTPKIITHNLGFMPLPIVQWSFTSDFSVCYEITERPGDYYPSDFKYAMTYGPVNANTIRLDFSDFLFGAPLTVYYRICCFMPHNVNSDVARIATLGDDFILNTDYNYTKLFNANITNENTTIYHNLGYKPQVIAWAEIDSGIRTIPWYGVGVYTSAIEVTDNTVVFPLIGITSTIKRFHYRIYLDEQS